MINTLDPNALTTAVNKLDKVRSFPLELSCANMPINTQYDIYMDGVKINAFCKPYGKNLGDPLISDVNGKLQMLFLFNITYDANYLTTQNDKSGYMTQNKTIEFRDPMGRSSFSQIPVRLKVTQ